MSEYEFLLMQSDEDAQIMASIYVGNDEQGNLVVSLIDNDGGWDYPEDLDIEYTPEVDTIATIDAESQIEMASYLDIPVRKLMEHLVEKFEEQGYIAKTSYIHERFKDILDYILDNGGRYSLKRVEKDD